MEAKAVRYGSNGDSSDGAGDDARYEEVYREEGAQENQGRLTYRGGETGGEGKWGETGRKAMRRGGGGRARLAAMQRAVVSLEQRVRLCVVFL